MFKSLMAFPLALILSLVIPARVGYGQVQSKELTYISRVKADIARRGTGRNARVTIKLRDGQELKGRIGQTDDNTFTITEDKTGKSTVVAFSQVKSVRGQGLSKGKKIGIISALAVGVVVLIGILSFKNFHPFENGVLR